MNYWKEKQKLAFILSTSSSTSVIPVSSSSKTATTPSTSVIPSFSDFSYQAYLNILQYYLDEKSTPSTPSYSSSSSSDHHLASLELTEQLFWAMSCFS
jgi:hypothetical protein